MPIVPWQCASGDVAPTVLPFAQGMSPARERDLVARIK
jgi:hypothetical protein